MTIPTILLALLLNVPPGPLQDVVSDYFTTKDIKALPRIELVDQRPPGGSPNAQGFINSGEHIIYIPTYSEVYQDAVRGDRDARMFLASVIAHELYHIQHGPAEGPAYDAQAFKLRKIGASDWLIQSVLKAKAAVLKHKS